MASITATSSASLVSRAGLVHPRRVRVSSSTVLGLPAMTKKAKITCSMEGKQEKSSNKAVGIGAWFLAGATAVSGQAMALVDERMSTEGTGLPFGLSSNLLGWILLGVFGLIWSLYFTYASSLDEDDDSGLSL